MTIFSKRHKNRSTSLEYRVMTVDRPNQNGRIYSRACMVEALKVFDARVVPMFGGFQEHLHNDGVFDLMHVAYEVESMELRGNIVFAKIRLLKTAQGTILKDMIELDLVEFRTAGTFYKLNADNVVLGYNMLAIVAMAKGTGA